MRGCNVTFSNKLNVIAMIAFPEHARPLRAQPLTNMKQCFETHKFAFANSQDMRELLVGLQLEMDWPAFSASWNNLQRDEFMADGGKYRSRRHCVFMMAADGTFDRLDHQPHYQSTRYNAVNGGIQRLFAPVEDATADSKAMKALLNLNRAIFCDDRQGQSSWRIELHQIRTEALGDKPGKPTPEGLHRDGVNGVFIMLVGHRNVGGDITTIADCSNRTRATLHLREPLEALFLDDTSLKHSVSPIWAVGDTSRGAYRDALIVTWKRLSPQD